MEYKSEYGSWALVVGGSTTVGEQFARQLGARGMNVAIVARRADRLEAIASGIRSDSGVETRCIPLDLMDDGAIEKLREATADLEVGFLVVNANLHKVNLFDLMPIEHKHVMLRMNYELPVKLTHIYGAQMVGRKRGGIVFVSALNALTPIEVDAVFQGTKAGLRVFAESLWLEYRKHGVRVGSAQVNGIEGSTSYEAKLSDGNRSLAKRLGVSMAPEKIVRQCLKQLERGRLVLVPDGLFPINLLVVKLLDFSRFFGGKLQLRLWSWVFGRFLDGDEVRDSLNSSRPTHQLGSGSESERP